MDNEWELSKENIQPRRQGRDIGCLMTALTPYKDENQKKINDERGSFEVKIRTYEGDDPLSVWSDYISWSEQYFPKDRKQTFKLLEKCIEEVLLDAKYKNDDRSLAIWLKYTDMTEDPLDTFKFMFSQKICSQFAAFYTDWALALENIDNLKMADEVLRIGLNRSAEPVRKLEDHIKRLEALVMKKVLEADEPENDEHNSKGRSALSTLKKKDKKGSVSYDRTNNKSKSKGIGMNVANNSNNKGTFNVYVDQENACPVNSLGGENSGWRKAPVQTKVTKENTDQPGPWSTARAPVGISKCTPAKQFAIHIDEEITTPQRTPRHDAIFSERKPLSTKKVEKQDSNKNFVHNLNKPNQPTSCMIACNMDKLYSGNDEFSFDEIRAALYFKKEDELRQLLLDDNKTKVVEIPMNLSPDVTTAILNRQNDEKDSRCMSSNDTHLRDNTSKDNQKRQQGSARQQLCFEGEEHHERQQQPESGESEIKSINHNSSLSHPSKPVKGLDSAHPSIYLKNESSCSPAAKREIGPASQIPSDDSTSKSLACANLEEDNHFNFENMFRSIRDVKGNPELEETTTEPNFSRKNENEFSRHETYEKPYSLFSVPKTSAANTETDKHSTSIHTEEAVRTVLAMFDKTIEVDKDQDTTAFCFTNRNSCDDFELQFQRKDTTQPSANKGKDLPFQIYEEDSLLTDKKCGSETGKDFIGATQETEAARQGKGLPFSIFNDTLSDKVNKDNWFIPVQNRPDLSTSSIAEITLKDAKDDWQELKESLVAEKRFDTSVKRPTADKRSSTTSSASDELRTSLINSDSRKSDCLLGHKPLETYHTTPSSSKSAKIARLQSTADRPPVKDPVVRMERGERSELYISKTVSSITKKNPVDTFGSHKGNSFGVSNHDCDQQEKLQSFRTIQEDNQFGFNVNKGHVEDIHSKPSAKDSALPFSVYQDSTIEETHAATVIEHPGQRKENSDNYFRIPKNGALSYGSKDDPPVFSVYEKTLGLEETIVTQAPSYADTSMTFDVGVGLPLTSKGLLSSTPFAPKFPDFDISDTRRDSEVLAHDKTSEHKRQRHCSGSSNDSMGPDELRREINMATSANSELQVGYQTAYSCICPLQSDLSPIDERTDESRTIPGPVNCTQPQSSVLSEASKNDITSSMSIKQMPGHSKQGGNIENGNTDIDGNLCASPSNEEDPVSGGLQVNPFCEDFVIKLICLIGEALDSIEGFQKCYSDIPKIQNRCIVDIGDSTYNVVEDVGSGGFAKVFKVLTDNNLGEARALKVLSSPALCVWEHYISSSIHRRIDQLGLPQNFHLSFVATEKAYILDDGGILDMKHYPGTLLDLVNLYKTEASTISEGLAALLTLEILKIVETLHTCDFLHCDIKPDNFLCIELDDNQDPLGNNILSLADFGRAVDLSLLSSDIRFFGSCNTESFECIQMRENKPWKHQIDYFAVANTLHVIIFGNYLNLYKQQDRWRKTTSFKRWWDQSLWNMLFDTLVNHDGFERSGTVRELVQSLTVRLSQCIENCDIRAELSAFKRLKPTSRKKH